MRHQLPTQRALDGHDDFDDDMRDSKSGLLRKVP